MKRTQIYLDEQLDRDLRPAAAAEGEMFSFDAEFRALGFDVQPAR